MRVLSRPQRLVALVLLFVFVAAAASAREPNRPIMSGKPSSALTTKNPQWRAGVERLKARAARLAGAKQRQRQRGVKERVRRCIGGRGIGGGQARASRDLHRAAV